MLLELQLEGLATVERLSWAPGPGLNVVTGESGAGKSVLVGAVALLFAGRVGPEALRTGAAAARVAGRFDGSGLPALAGRAEELGVGDLADFVLQREISSDGRSRFRLDGRPLPQAQARELGALLLDMHGQHEHQSLLRPECHLELLDRCAARADLGPAERAAAERLEAARAAQRRFAEESRERGARRELWEFQLQELDAARLRAGEDAELERERQLLAHAEQLAEALQEAAAALEDDPHGALSRVGAARRALGRVQEWDERLGGPLGELAEAAERLAEAARDLAHRAASLETDPARLRAVEERLEVLYRIRKRFGGNLESALRQRAELAARLAESERPAEAAARLERELESARTAWLAARRTLHAAREAAAAELTTRLGREWREVGLPGARFQVRMGGEPPDAGEAGWPHQAEFLVSTNPGEELKPLARVASGGEVSRIMLGIKSALAGADPVGTLLFDEIDAGIGGRTAEAVGAKLRRLARRHQVLCITHLPVLAACADRHFQVDKAVRGGRTYTRVVELGSRERVEELCRMLAGSRVTDATRHEARALLRHAAAGPA
ncbi:MAG TPA: DNA repair protein RecN [Candidatus Saccharimonadales bacterium]|nr:DNA repair protein RecN [Candidatus Saccharimonadales bacterium]